MPYRGRFNPHAYYDVDTCGRCTQEIKKLISAGFVYHINEGVNKEAIILTDAGKQFKCEVEELIPVWIVTCDQFGVNIQQQKGVLIGNSFKDEDGYTVKKTATRTFFTDRKQAYTFALSEQQARVNMSKKRVESEQANYNKLNLEYNKIQDESNS
jgi:hypothetical protein